MPKTIVTRDKRKLLVPTDLAEADLFISQIAGKSRQLALIETRCKNAIQRAKEEAEEHSQPLQAEVDDLKYGIYLFCEQKKDEICADNVRSIKLKNGILGWRWSNWAVGEIEDVIKLIKKLRKAGLRRFIRRPPPELDKPALLKERQLALTYGVPFSRKEKFYIKPEEVAEIVIDEDDLNIVVAEERT